MSHCYEFAAPDGVFGLRSEADIAAPLALYAGRWPWREVSALVQIDIDITRLDQERLSLRMRAAGDAALETDSAIDAASAALDMLIRLTMERLGPYAMLHAGSALIDGALVAFPGQSYAGKSTLALQLAARGHLLGGDDRLVVGPLDRRISDGVEGVLLGLNARIRLPVDPRAGDEFIRFVEKRRLSMPALAQRLAFVAPAAAEMAPYGRRAPLVALVIPQRRDSGGVALEPASISDIMRLLLEEFFAPHWSAAALTDAARSLAQALPRFVLRFDNSALAAAEIERLVRSGLRELAV